MGGFPELPRKVNSLLTFDYKQEVIVSNEKGKKKLVVVEGGVEQTDEVKAAEQERRDRVISLVNLLKQGPYEIEITVPLTGEDAEIKYHCLAPWEQPLHVDARTHEGQALAAYMTQFGIDATVHDDKLFMSGLIEWNLEGLTISPDAPLKEQAKAAFTRFHDELPKRVTDRITACLKVLRDTTGPKIALPTAADNRKFGG